MTRIVIENPERQIDLLVEGKNFPTDPEIDFYCVFGGTDDTNALFLKSKALMVSDTQLICVDIPVYTNALLPVTMYVDFHLSYNLQEFWGRKRIMYFKVTTITSLDYYKFVPSRHMTLKVDGVNFVNTADSLLCKLEQNEN